MKYKIIEKTHMDGSKTYSVHRKEHWYSMWESLDNDFDRVAWNTCHAYIPQEHSDIESAMRIMEENWDVYKKQQVVKEESKVYASNIYSELIPLLRS